MARNMQRKKVKHEQPRKDSKVKRVNADNERLSKFEKEYGTPKTCKSNDVSWYAKTPELLRAAASIPFSTVTGAVIPTAGTASVPGVMTLHWLPSIGGWDDNAVDSAKASYYSYVVHANSRNTSYNDTDLMLVTLAGAQIFSALASAIRAYGTMRRFDQRNRYLPRVLIRAMGFNYEDLQANLSNMWFDINEMIARSQQIWIPNTFPFLTRWFWLNSNIYMDSESIKGQMYMFVQDKFWTYDALQTEQGGGLSWVLPNGQPLDLSVAGANTTQAYTNSSLHTWAQFKTMINGLFNALLDSEDRGLIMGDILKAYGEDKIYALSPISVDYQIEPVYDREVLTQVENATVFGQDYLRISQEQTTRKLVTEWGALTGGNKIDALPGQNVLNFHTREIPTPEMVMVATRLKVMGAHPIPNPSNATKLLTVVPSTIGTEYVGSIVFYMYNNANPNNIIATVIDQYFAGAPSSYQTYALGAFDWCPWQYRINQSEFGLGDPIANVQTSTIDTAYGDWDMYTFIDTEELRKMHTTAVYSEFDVPTLG